MPDPNQRQLPPLRSDDYFSHPSSISGQPIPPDMLSSYNRGYDQNLAFGARHRKATRAKQVSIVSHAVMMIGPPKYM